MANFPTTLDSLTNPSGSDYTDNPSLSSQLSTLNDIAELVEAKVGVDSSAVTTSHDYKLSGVTGTTKAVSLTGTETLTNKTLTTPTITAGVVATSLDMDGKELILDADQDTSITADTDDQIDFKVGGNDILWIGVDSVQLKAGGSNQFNLNSHPLVTDADSDSYLASNADDELSWCPAGVEKIKFTSNLQVKGGVLLTDTISEYNTGAGVTITNQEAWTEVTYENSWVAYDAATYYGWYYMKDSMGFVHLRGLGKDGTAPTATMFTLPVGYRPDVAQIQPGVSYNNVFCRITVNATGTVLCSAGGAVNWISLNGITFKAA